MLSFKYFVRQGKNKNNSHNTTPRQNRGESTNARDEREVRQVSEPSRQQALRSVHVLVSNPIDPCALHLSTTVANV
jgi:hypothetical protein